ncbi:hypothetical protein HanXRQr2_Chr10g0448771 [Helianthus annuus]|uniref:Uncharacterized protein n=1 Tax=Helianthus annuus TaxID=4232 RepID=A0A9K3HYV5_HELAN|nr:hypothetical protein HanXRQr2_Chr10g0448771 [Helianthus annuus]KAJ0522550.1 hypothetical protein HanIR_Chr10g0483841 [Helianthus annuus]
MLQTQYQWQKGTGDVYRSNVCYDIKLAEGDVKREGSNTIMGRR